MILQDLPNEVIEALDVLDLRQLLGLRFVVQIDGVGFRGKETVAGFRSISGLDSDLDIATVREGGVGQVHTFPRRERQPTVSLVRPVTYSRSLWNWFDEGRRWYKGRPDYTRTMSIYLLDGVTLSGVTGAILGGAVAPVAGEIVYEAWRWDFSRCWISNWRGPTLDANTNAIALEEVTIQHGGFVEAKGVLSGTAGEILSVFQ